MNSNGSHKCRETMSGSDKIIEESKILRKNQFALVPIEISCEEIESKYRISTICDLDDFAKCPVIKENGVPFSEHPMLRPFDKFLIKGNPDIGEVTHVFILYHEINRPVMVCSIVKTKKRILLLPAWGKGTLKPISKQNLKKQAPIAHMTVEEDKKGDFKLHYTGGPIRRGKKEKIYPRRTLKFDNKHGTHVGTLGVNELKNLDPLGIVYRDLKENELPRSNIEEVQRILTGALKKNHPLFNLPKEFTWDNEHHLEISFAIIGSKLDNVPYPKIEFLCKKKIPVEQLNKIPIDTDKSLLVNLTMCSGKLNNDFQWIVTHQNGAPN